MKITRLIVTCVVTCAMFRGMGHAEGLKPAPAPTPSERGNDGLAADRPSRDGRDIQVLDEDFRPRGASPGAKQKDSHAFSVDHKAGKPGVTKQPEPQKRPLDQGRAITATDRGGNPAIRPAATASAQAAHLNAVHQSEMKGFAEARKDGGVFAKTGNPPTQLVQLPHLGGLGASQFKSGRTQTFSPVPLGGPAGFKPRQAASLNGTQMVRKY
jgi:hypothetical protein